MLVFRKTWRALFSCYHRLEIRLFALLYRRFVLFYLTLYNINNILCKKKIRKLMRQVYLSLVSENVGTVLKISQ